MVNPRLIGMIGLIGAAGSSLCHADDGAILSARWLYNPVHRPVLVDIRPASDDVVMTAVLMSAQGNMHTEPVSVRAGAIDLAAEMPDIWKLRRTAYLQLIVNDVPTGSALVIQPMLSRLIPVTEEIEGPNGIYTAVTRWYDETHPERLEVAEGAVPTNDAAAPPEDPWLAHQPPSDRLLSGLRIYIERDVRLWTDQGPIRIALRPDEAPNTAWSFRSLAEGGFYRGIAFHRVVPMTRVGDPFVIQAGDPTGTGNGGPGYWLPIEPSRLPHDFGVVSMARDVAPDSAGSQFFICLSRGGTARLDGHYCAFGQAVTGADVIMQIAGVELADVASGRPLNPPVIESAELVPAPPRELGRGRPDDPVRRPAEPVGSEPVRVPR